MLMMINYNDEQLVESLVRGDEAAITEIYSRYWRKLLAIAYSHAKDKSAAEEIVQEVLIKLWDRRSKLKIYSLPNYLAMAVKYSVFNYLQRERRRSEIDAFTLPKNDYNFDDEKIYAQFLKEYINGVVEKLPEKCRIVFQFSRENGKTTSEIAEDLDISPKTVEAHLTKAIKTIRYSLRSTGIFILTLTISVFLS
jgi:RNA polymerase sigma-70 factor (family 1)